MAKVLETVMAFFDEDEWPYEVSEEESALVAGYLGENGEYTCVLRTREAEAQILFYAICPEIIPPAKRPAVAEFITRANYGMYLGNFEMDFEDGEVRYKTAADIEEQVFTSLFVKNLVYACVATMDRYMPGIRRLVSSEDPPARVVRELEEGVA